MGILYQDNNEYNYTNSGTSYTTFWNDVSLKLPSKFTFEVELKTTGQTSNAEGRLYVHPTESYTGNSQPNPGAWCGFGGNNTSIQAGIRTSLTDEAEKTVSDSRNTWWKYKLVKDGNSFTWYYNDTLITTKTLSQWNNYTNFSFSIVQWSSGNTLSIRNIKITFPHTISLLKDGLMELSETMAVNLNNKGIQASPYDGLSTLADKITKTNAINLNRDNYYVIDNTTDLMNLCAQSNQANLDNSVIFIKQGNYRLTSWCYLNNCDVVSNGANIYQLGFVADGNSTGNVSISGLNFDGENTKNRGDTGFIFCDCNTTNIHITNCTFTNVYNQWNAHSIRITRTNSDHTLEINNCEFTGRNDTSGYGHTLASIAGFHYGSYTNVQIHHNIFNHNSNGAGNVFNNKAIALFNNSSSSVTLNNCKAYCNQYLGQKDTNVGISESACPSTTTSDKLMDNLNTLGTKIASNLAKKYVTASASDGLTTLANKINNIAIEPIEIKLKGSIMRLRNGPAIDTITFDSDSGLNEGNIVNINGTDMTLNSARAVLIYEPSDHIITIKKNHLTVVVDVSSLSSIGVSMAFP